MSVTDKQVPLFPLLLSNFIGTIGFSIVLPFLGIFSHRFWE
jgi:DHA1 family tetracycline resistance protein-like MFS transporter